MGATDSLNMAMLEAWFLQQKDWIGNIQLKVQRA